MGKGTSTAIVTLLVIVISISGVMLTYFWLSQTTNVTQEQTMNIYDTNTNIGCLSIENIDTDSDVVVVRNCGSVELSNVALYVDAQTVGTKASVPAGSLVEIGYDLSPGEHEIYATSRYARSSVLKIDTEGNILTFDFWLTPDNGYKRLVCV